LQADGVLAYMRGDWAECWQRSEQARVQVTGVSEIEAAATFLQAMVLLGRGRLPEARLAFERTRAALATVRSGRPFFTPMMLGFVVEEADAGPRLYFEETVLPGPHVSAEQAQGYLVCNLAYLARHARDLDEARVLVEQAGATFASLGDRDGESLALSHLGCLHRARGDYAAGRVALEHSLRLRHEIGDRRAIGLTLGNLGVLTAAEGDLRSGLALLEQALAGFGETEDAPGLVGVSLTVASVHAHAGDFAAARRLLAGVLRESEHIPGNHRATPWGYTMLADVLRRLGEPDAAALALARAREQFRALGALDGAGKVAAKRC
jgi:tetratricopeptide (TPR) repeat protein